MEVCAVSSSSIPTHSKIIDYVSVKAYFDLDDAAVRAILLHVLSAFLATSIKLSKLEFVGRGLDAFTDKSASIHDYAYWTSLHDKRLCPQTTVQWAPVDDLLSRTGNAAQLISVNFSMSPAELPRHYRCEKDLARTLFPTFIASQNLNACGGYCTYHK